MDQTKPAKRKWWVWVAGALVILLIIGLASSRKKNTAVSEQKDTATTVQPQVIAEDTHSTAMDTTSMSHTPMEPPTTAEAEKIVRQSVSSSFIKKVQVKGQTLEVQLKEASESDPIFATYYSSGDKRNKILAIESIRWLVKLPGIDKVDLTITADGETSNIVMPRSEVESYVGASLASYSDGEGSINDKWRNEFLPVHDTKSGRMAIVERFRK